MRDGQLREGDVLARRYTLKHPVGTGGMSVVWRAWDSTLERTVAVKVLDGPIGTGVDQRDRIRREARALARIEHPHALGVYDYGETVTPHGRIAAYVVMQLLDGVSLANRLAEGPLPWADAVGVAATVADVLHAAHRRGVVHRDVSAENVMLTGDGVKLLDFGIATDVGQADTLTFGTPPYVAPERLVGAPASGATDVYALGVLLYEMLAGTPPYPANSWEELERAVAGEPPPALTVASLPPSVAAICMRCLAADPTERPTAAEVAAVLAAAVARADRRWLPVLAGVVVVLALGGAGYVWYDLSRHPAGTALPLPSVSVVASAPPPAPTATNPPSQPARATSAPAGTSRTVPSATPRLTPQQAGKAVLDIVDRRVAAGEIREDVATDLRNQVTNMVAHPDDVAHHIATLRENLRERRRSNGVSEAAYTELDAAVVVLGDALLA